MTHVRVFRHSRSILGESLVWDSSSTAVLWCDIPAGLLRVSPWLATASGASDWRIELAPPVASFGLATDGYVVSHGDRVVLCDSAWRIVAELASITHAHDGMRLNEGKVDPAGRWVTGSMNLVGDTPDGAFYSVTSEGATLLIGGVGTANGLEWSLDGTRVYFTDSSVGTIYTGAYSASGEVTDVEVFHRGAHHDGLVIDRDGCLWSAIYGGSCVIRLSPEGVELERIGLPAPNVTSVTFAGPELTTLLVASARENLTERQLTDYPLSGSVFALQLETGGRQPYVFG